MKYRKREEIYIHFIIHANVEHVINTSKISFI